MFLINDGQPFLARRPGDVGLTAKQLRSLREHAQVRTMFRGVCIDALATESRAVRCRAASLVVPPEAVVCFETAAWGHEGYLPEKDVWTLDGLRVTSPVRTTVDLLRRLWRPFALGAADAMAHAGLVSVGDVDERVRQLKHFPGIVQARELAPLIEPLAESVGESAQRLRILDAGFPRPTPQLLVLDRRGIPVARLDEGYDELKVGVFYDGRPFHTDDDMRRIDDVKRRTLTEDLHWRLVIGTRETIFGKDPQFELQLGELLGLQPLLPRSW
jgi:hypothetical protein